jgi:rhodanese-related sulfurtransferase
MATLAFALAFIALVVALTALSRAGRDEDLIRESDRADRRRLDSLAEERERSEKNLRMVVAAMADGQKLSRKQVLEGILWRDVNDARGVEMVKSGDVCVVDVRTAEEVAEGAIPGAIHVPVEEIEERYREIPNDGRPTLVYCAGGVRSVYACEFLTSEGYTNLFNLEGGMMTWTGPVERP